VNTAFENRCLEYQLEISFEEDVERVKKIMLKTLTGLDGVLSHPPAEVLVTGLTHDSVTLRLSWWTRKAEYSELLHLQDTMLTTLKAQLAAHHVIFPTPSQHILLQQLPEKKQEHQADSFALHSTSGLAENGALKDMSPMPHVSDHDYC
jgi:small-conductance mechanosensitive channel